MTVRELGKYVATRYNIAPPAQTTINRWIRVGRRLRGQRSAISLKATRTLHGWHLEQADVDEFLTQLMREVPSALS